MIFNYFLFLYKKTGGDVLENSSLTNTIIQTINSIFQTLFSSIDNSVYQVLDELTFIHSNILNNSLFEKLFGTLLIHVKLNGTVKQKTLKSTGEYIVSSNTNIGTGLKILIKNIVKCLF